MYSMSATLLCQYLIKRNTVKYYSFFSSQESGHLNRFNDRWRMVQGSTPGMNKMFFQIVSGIHPTSYS